MLIFRFAAALLLAIALPALAQEPQAGRVNGRILDAYQAQPLPGVTVEVK